MKIGIAGRLFNHKLYVNEKYLEYIKDLGFSYGIITMDSDLEEYDFFLLPGGYDVNPCFYDEENTASVHVIEYNDLLDFKIIEFAIKKNKPLLGICRGIQSINVYFGGSLKQDITAHTENNHFISFKDKYYLVNSFHHQSIKRVGNQLSVLATSLDGEIEMIQYKKIIGVQFHPELMHTPIIDYLIFNLISEV